MEKEHKSIPFEDFASQLNTIFDQVATAGQAITVEREGKQFTLRPKARRTPRARQRFSLDDPLFEIIGAGRSEGPTDVSRRKHHYLAEAISHQGRPSAPGPDAPHQALPTRLSRRRRTSPQRKERPRAAQRGHPLTSVDIR